MRNRVTGLAAAFSFTVLLSTNIAARANIPIPISGTAPAQVLRPKERNPNVLQLAGTWRFSLTHGAVMGRGFVPIVEGPATASSSQTGHQPNDALGIVSTAERWCASGDGLPQWWMADLGKPETPAGLTIAWEFADAYYRYKVEGSLDRHKWSVLADHTADPGGQDGTIPLSPTPSRWLRITIVGTKNTGGPVWASIRRVRIMLTENGKDTEWKPTIPKADASHKDAFTLTNFDDKTWSDIPVPANWEMQGLSQPTYDGPDNAVGLYRRWVTIPAGFAGKHVIWHFDGVFDGAEVFVNGKSVGYHESGYTAFDLDITKAIRPGQRNLLALRVSKSTYSVDLDTGDYWSLGGIYRENYLLALPRTFVKDVSVTTDLDARYKDARIKAEVSVAGSPGTPVQVSGHLTDAKGGPVPNTSVVGQARVGANGTALLHLERDVKTPRLWSAEKPNLYHLVLTLAQNKTIVETARERFGFKKIEIRNGVVLWNGVPIKCTGTCRHEEWAAYGHALHEAQWRTDLMLMKNANINAVRTSHYNHAERFLELCDEIGIYVLDEVPACWCNVNDPRLKPAFVQRTRETLARDKNKPCVLAWSLSNESGYGPNVQAMLDYAKGNDPTRPAFISQCGPWNNPKIDFHDAHYPSIQDVKRISTEKLRETTPVVFTEQPHIFYIQEALDYDWGVKDFWGQALVANWNVIWPTDSMLGSFIWEWQDQGIADKFESRAGVDKEGLRDNNHKGIVDGYRNPKPEYWNIKMAYSPVTTTAREIEPANGRVEVPIRNRYSFTDLSELTCRRQTLANGRVIDSGEQHIACPPRSTTTASFPVAQGVDTLHLEFIHPDGRTIYVADLRVKGTEPAAPAPIISGREPARITTVEAKIEVATKDFRLVFDGSAGQIETWQVRGQNVLIGGPILNLGEARVTHGEHDARNFIASAEPPRLNPVHVKSMPQGDVTRIEVSADVLLAESSDPKGRIEYTLDIHPDAQIDVAWKLTWTSADANAWELGMKFLMPAGSDKLTWLRNGLWTAYPKEHIGADRGTVSSRDISFRSTKRDVRWAEFFGAGDVGLAVLSSDGPLHVRGNVDKDRTVLFLSSAVAPPHDFSSNLLPEYAIHLRPGETVGGSFRLRAVANTK